VKTKIAALDADAVAGGVAKEEIRGIVASLRNSLTRIVGSQRGAVERSREAVEGRRSGDRALIGQKMLALAVKRPAELNVVGSPDVVVVLLPGENLACERSAVVSLGVRLKIADARDVRESDLRVRIR